MTDEIDEEDYGEKNISECLNRLCDHNTNNNIFHKNNCNIIYNFIKSNPGCILHEIARNIHLNVSTVNYYITQLKKSDLIKITKIGKFKRMYDFNHKIEINLTPNQEKIFRLIKEKPGLSQKDIIKYSNYSQSTTSRIIDELNTKKFLLYEIKNKKTVYFLNTLKDFRKE